MLRSAPIKCKSYSHYFIWFVSWNRFNKNLNFTSLPDLTLPIQNIPKNPSINLCLSGYSHVVMPGLKTDYQWQTINTNAPCLGPGHGGHHGHDSLHTFTFLLWQQFTVLSISSLCCDHTRNASQLTTQSRTSSHKYHTKVIKEGGKKNWKVTSTHIHNIKLTAQEPLLP